MSYAMAIMSCAMVIMSCAMSEALATATLHAHTPSYDGVVRDDPDGSQVAYMIPPYKSNHASTLEVMDDGTLVAAWFSGEAEEASGCAIVFAKLPNGSSQWSKASTLSKRDGYSNQNPVLFYEKSTQVLHLFHSQAAAESGEGQATIWHLSSSDGGDNWTKPRLWLKDPGSFPRNRIIPDASNKGVIFPFYNAGKANSKFHNENYAVMGFSGSDRVLNDSSTWKFIPVAGSADLVQPTVVRDSTANLISFFRDRRAENIYSAKSHDDGQSWSTPKKTALPNNNAGIEANVLPNGHFVMAFNPQTSGRDPLAIAVSTDNGVMWTKQRNLQYGVSAERVMKGNEFSYPTVLTTNDGIIHVMYTYLRETIKYKRFNETWISQAQPSNGKFLIVTGVDAGAAPGNVSLVATTKDLSACETLCKQNPDCSVFDFNSHSGHCYNRYDGLWIKKTNDHVTSGCRVGVVKGCSKAR